MMAVILAAVDGTRLRPLTDEIPKPLIPLLGVPLIERVILSAKEAGINEFVIVIGYLGNKLKEVLGDGGRYGVKIEYVKNEEWEKPNGFSVYKARSVLKEDFILLMADHIFDPMTLSTFKDYQIEGKESALCVDYNIENIFDIKDATKVEVVDGKIRETGKELEEYNAIDTGMFLCSPYLFEVLGKNLKEGRYSLSESVETLAKQNLMKAYDIKGYFWHDIDTEEGLKNAESLIQIGENHV
jgi:choline kinase